MFNKDVAIITTSKWDITWKADDTEMLDSHANGLIMQKGDRSF